MTHPSTHPPRLPATVISAAGDLARIGRDLAAGARPSPELAAKLDRLSDEVRQAARMTRGIPGQDPADADGHTAERHLLRLIGLSLDLPRPDRSPSAEAEWSTCLARRAAAVLAAIETALASPHDGTVVRAARDLDAYVADTPAVYPAAPALPRMTP